MGLRAVLLAILSLLVFAIPAEAQVQQQCALDKSINTGGTVFNQCPVNPTGETDGYLIAQGYFGARLDPDVDLSRTPIWIAGICRYVDSRGTVNALMIPFGTNNSSQEFPQFLANAPTGIHTAQCCLPRKLTVGDIPPVTVVPNLPACANGWKFDGLVADASSFLQLIAAPTGTAATATFTMQNGVAENANRPISQNMPIERDDIHSVLPMGAAAGTAYNARYHCDSTQNGGPFTQYQIVQFVMECDNADWGNTGVSCTGGTIGTFSDPCPNGGSGSILKQVTRSCPSGQVTVQELSNTCTSACVPGQVGDPVTVQCPAGQTGSITRINVRQCPSGTIVQQETSNTCTTSQSCTPPANICPTGSTPTCTTVNGSCQCACSGSCPSGQVDLGITTTQCPNGASGVIQTHTFRSCTTTNNQCICGLAATEEDNCSTNGTCTPTTPADCPSGQSPVCTPSGPNNQCNCLCAPGNGQCTNDGVQCPSGQTRRCSRGGDGDCSCTCQPSTCTPDPEMQCPAGQTPQCTTTNGSCTCGCAPSNCAPVTDLGNSNRACPAGQTGTVVINTKKICTSTNGQCVCHNEETEVTRACEGVTCPASTDLGNVMKACDPGQSGMIVVHRIRTCTSSNGACTCQNTDTPVSNTCTVPTQCVPVTDLGNQTQACPSGQNGQIVVNTKRICQVAVGCSQNNCPPGQCFCHDETTTVSNTCASSCTPSTDLGTSVLACPAGQSGSGITIRTIKECTPCNGQCVCTNRIQVLHEDCEVSCTPRENLDTKTLQCPMGQDGAIVVQRVKVCTPCNGQCQCSIQEVPLSNTCHPVCTPSTRTATEQCPAGFTGNIVKTFQTLCDCPGGREVLVNVQNNCVPIPQCVPSTHSECLPCPDGFMGSRTRLIRHVCDCPGGRDIVSEDNQCFPIHHSHPRGGW